MKRIGIIDYGAGNLHSVRKALAYLGAETEILEEAPKTISFNSLVLPGVGNFGPGMEELEKRGFHQFLGEWFREDRPFLGICLGMQFLFETMLWLRPRTANDTQNRTAAIPQIVNEVL